MPGAFGGWWAVAPIIEEVLELQPELVQHGLGRAAGMAVDPDVILVRDNPERGIMIIVGWAADGPLTAAFSAAAAALHNLLCTLAGRPTQGERWLHDVEIGSG
jgi:hypothetical protein